MRYVLLTLLWLVLTITKAAAPPPPGLPTTPAECAAQSPVAGAEDPLLTCQTRSVMNQVAADVNTHVYNEIPGGCECFGSPGYDVTLEVGDITPNSGGTVTDVNGTVWGQTSGLTNGVAGGPGWWFGGLTKNGVVITDGYFTGLRKVANGHVWGQASKRAGWEDLTVHAYNDNVFLDQPGPNINDDYGGCAVSSSQHGCSPVK